ncbi:hypothetical protein Goshw_028078, partial [Gossypium schwendimanii]|nr:hypothetical protein [Gossypium schwendimanii]
MWGILESLVIVIERVFNRIIIISDSLEVIQAVQESGTKVSNSAS